MSFLPEGLKTQTFPCPNCQQYISSEVPVCRFCSMPITEELKQAAIKKELNEKKIINLNWHKNTLALGLVLFGVGVFLLISTIIEIKYSNSVNINCLTPILIVAGIVTTIKGIMGYREEKLKS